MWSSKVSHVCSHVGDMFLYIEVRVSLDVLFPPLSLPTVKWCLKCSNECFGEAIRHVLSICARYQTSVCGDHYLDMCIKCTLCTSNDDSSLRGCYVL